MAPLGGKNTKLDQAEWVGTGSLSRASAFNVEVQGLQEFRKLRKFREERTPTRVGWLIG